MNARTAMAIIGLLVATAAPATAQTRVWYQLPGPTGQRDGITPRIRNGDYFDATVGAFQYNCPTCVGTGLSVVTREVLGATDTLTQVEVAAAYGLRLPAGFESRTMQSSRATAVRARGQVNVRAFWVRQTAEAGLREVLSEWRQQCTFRTEGADRSRWRARCVLESSLAGALVDALLEVADGARDNHLTTITMGSAYSACGARAALPTVIGPCSGVLHVVRGSTRVRLDVRRVSPSVAADGHYFDILAPYKRAITGWSRPPDAGVMNLDALTEPHSRSVRALRTLLAISLDLGISAERSTARGPALRRLVEWAVSVAASPDVVVGGTLTASELAALLSPDESRLLRFLCLRMDRIGRWGARAGLLGQWASPLLCNGRTTEDLPSISESDPQGYPTEVLGSDGAVVRQWDGRSLQLPQSVRDHDDASLATIAWSAEELDDAVEVMERPGDEAIASCSALREVSWALSGVTREGTSIVCDDGGCVVLMSASISFDPRPSREERDEVPSRASRRTVNCRDEPNLRGLADDDLHARIRVCEAVRRAELRVQFGVRPGAYALADSEARVALAVGQIELPSMDELLGVGGGVREAYSLSGLPMSRAADWRATIEVVRRSVAAAQRCFFGGLVTEELAAVAVRRARRPAVVLTETATQYEAFRTESAGLLEAIAGFNPREWERIDNSVNADIQRHNLSGLVYSQATHTAIQRERAARTAPQ